jgi:asparagine synthase (glutamine-hydrolysing)
VCGIAGVVGTGAVRREDVELQLKLLSHRGPDSAGVFAAGPGIIGQTRLAIIDLVTGDPPITNEDGRIGVALNGEIYNYGDVRQQLVAHGHQLRTATDTEVLAHLAEEDSPASLAQRLEGMFAFAIWDSDRERLILGRDRLGKRPLYYWSDSRNLVFASEIKALLAHPLVPRRLRPDAVGPYVTFGYVPTPDTFYEGIRSVPPGHILVADAGGISLEPYWELPVPRPGGRPYLDLSFEEAAERVRTLLDAAVRRRLVADVPIGAFLSGGVDSSAVVALMAGASSSVRTFSIGFEDPTFDERQFARIVAQRFGTQHTEFVVRPDAVELIEELVAAHDQPFGDSTAVPTYLLSNLTREHVTVALCGDGGDELFAGYERFAAGVAMATYQRLPLTMRRLLRSAARALPASARSGRMLSLARFAEQGDQDLLDAFRSWVGYVPDDWLTAMLPPTADWGLSHYRGIWQESEGAAVLDRLLHLNMRTYLLDDLLPKVDRTSMAHALEVRSPFLDRELLEFVACLPPSYKQRGLSLKRVLKLAVRDLVPAEILRRPKQGFGVPLGRWFRSDLRRYGDGLLRAPKSHVGQFLNPRAIGELLDEHHAGARDHGEALWTLLTLEVFLRQELA